MKKKLKKCGDNDFLLFLFLGSSNSQDSFPPVGGSGSSMDGYSGYGYPPGSTPDYSGPNQRPAQTSAPSPHPGSFF